LLNTGFWAVFASKTHFFKGSSRFVLLPSRATICCSKAAFCGTSGFLSSLNSATSNTPSVKPSLIRSIFALSEVRSDLRRSIFCCFWSVGDAAPRRQPALKTKNPAIMRPEFVAGCTNYFRAETGALDFTNPHSAIMVLGVILRHSVSNILEHLFSKKQKGE